MVRSSTEKPYSTSHRLVIKQMHPTASKKEPDAAFLINGTNVTDKMSRRIYSLQLLLLDILREEEFSPIMEIFYCM